MTKQIKRVYLEAGDGILTKTPQQITTILGSCLSIVMYHRLTGYAGISHSQLPSFGEETSYKNIFSKEAYKYVDSSFKRLLKYFDKENIDIHELDVKVFGGGEIMVNGNPKGDSVGKQNILMAEKLLRDYNLKLKASDVGGTYGRKLIFDTSTGNVFLKKI